ncbi:MAG: AAA family ATPase [Oscillospiraceae bacterium]|nr:AAA family ATPase [Oscillospiraceae bacterium]
MKYKLGLYGGSFNPLHMGHVECIIRSANQCERLLVVISHGTNRREIDVRERYRWIYQLTKHIGNVELMILEDTAATKADYNCEECWFADAQKVRERAGASINAVFCGSDYGEDSFWAKCYPEAELVIYPRNGISSTLIRENPYRHWELLPNVVKPHYVKKVLLIGAESTGKSTLTENLANYFNTNFLEEVGRDISERSGTDTLMLPEDFTDILLTHKLREREAVKHSRMVLFEDTDCLITRFFLEFLEGKDKERNIALANAIASLNDYDLILFLEPDVKFVQDGDRSEVIAADREYYSTTIKNLYREHGFAFVEVRGSYEERFQRAVELTREMLNI